MRIYTFANRLALLTCLRQAFCNELHQVSKGGVRQTEGRGVRKGCGHVRDAVMEYTVGVVSWIGVGGRMRGFEASALIDCDVHDDSAGLHQPDHVATDQTGSRGSGNQN